MTSLFDVIPAPILVLAICIPMGYAVFTILTQLQDRSAARSSLREFQDELAIDDEREKQLLSPIRTRLVTPILDGAGQLGSRVNPPEYIEQVRIKHVQAGISSAETVEKFLAFRLFGFVFIPIWVGFVLVFSPFGVAGWTKIGLAALGGVIGFFGPTVTLDRKIESRQRQIQRALPDVLDLLVISVEAGLGFEQAVDKVIFNMPGPLSDEFTRVLGETRAGAARADALRSMQERVDTPEVRSFVLAMIQADTFGVSIGRVLRAQADEMRVKRRQLAQEQAQKAPVKMLIPMVFCIFPSLFVVILGPALLNIAESL